MTSAVISGLFFGRIGIGEGYDNTFMFRGRTSSENGFLVDGIEMETSIFFHRRRLGRPDSDSSMADFIDSVGILPPKNIPAHIREGFLGGRY